ncbi:MAG: DUF2497 domain-containing protein [Proteobacteria bacterium]|nr:DUF2497 domain-containing protein [Pseudomonadota bacterium]
MSRLESNAEPSMEEILASIRKIIAEDSSGLRTSTATARSGAPYTPVPKASPLPTSSPQPRSGFMTREAFLKSSQPVEPEPTSEYHAPVGTPSRSVGDFAGGGSAASRLQSRDDARSAKPSFSMRESAPVFHEQETARAKDGLRVKEDVRSTEEPRPKETAPEPVEKEQALTAAPERPTPAPDEIIAIDAASVETVIEEVASVEEVSPIAEDDVPTTVADESERNVSKLAAASESDTARIEAQLSELLSEDLNALREGRASSPTVAADDERKDAKASRNEKPESAPIESEANTDTSDPFAFDLGPSPFAARSEPPRTAPAASAPAPLPAAPSSSSPFDVPHASGLGRTAHAEGDKPKNGSPVSPPTPGFAAFERTPDIASPSAPEAEAPPAKPRPAFAFPSVSATLGPSRKLEPLSNAFRPAPPPEPFIPVAEVIPEPVRAPESARPKETPPPHAASDRNEEDASHSMLPATTSDGPDRAMEDAVADLLRPLLKTWLSENMPKIVERALRREMSERLLPNQKSPKD